MGEALQALAAQLEQAESLLDDPALEPDPGRNDWGSLGKRVRLALEAVERDVLGALDAALEEVGEGELHELIRLRVAWLLASAAAPVHLAGEASAAGRLRARAGELTPDEAHRAELAAAQHEPEVHARLMHARWLRGHDRRREADQLLKRVLREAGRPALREAAKRALRAPRPLTRAPALFRLNGCGVGLYGERDRGADGFYVATYCVSLLWIPLLPLAAYRVRRVDGDSYQFRAREALGPIARAWQALVLAGALTGAAAWGFKAYQESPGHRAAIALEEARAAEAAGDTQAALERYRSAVRELADQTDVTPAGEGVVRLAAAQVKEPCTTTSIDEIRRVVYAYQELPPGARGGAAALLRERLEAWAGQIGDATPAQASASLGVLDLASQVAEGGEGEAAIQRRRDSIRRALADRMAPARPLLALEQYVRLGDPGALSAAKQIIDGFGDAPSLWVEAGALVERWADAARGDGAAATRDRLAAARAAQVEDLALIQAGDEAAIRKALGARPGDQELAAALAAAERGRGDVKAAIARLTALGPLGRLTAGAQQALAACHAEAGDLARADEVLTGLLEERLPPFQEAQRAFLDAAQNAERQLLSSLQAGTAPPSLEAKLRGTAGEAAQREIIGAWISEQLDGDPRLAALRAEYLRHGAVVPASLSLGTVKLRRAAEARGGDRQALLADAQRVFLAIRQEAAGDPAFHLGLGQVYHRLGKPAEGDAELKGLLDRGVPELSLAVAHAYRELGLVKRARQITEQAYASAPGGRMRNEAAMLRARIAEDLDEEELWTRRADASLPEVQNHLDNVTAKRLLRDGKRAEADRTFVQVAQRFERDARRDPVAANNAAVAYMNRYSSTGDPAHLRKAVAHLDSSARLAADNALVLGNLASAHHHLAVVTVLERWVRTRALALDASSAEDLLDALLDGPLRGDLLAALGAEPSFRRALDVSRQRQILAPQDGDAYQLELGWLVWSADAKGLDELLRRLSAMPEILGEDAAAERQSWEAGEKDEQLRRLTAEALARARQQLAEAELAAHAPTRAAALLGLGRALGGRAYLDLGASTAEMVDAYRKAAEAWPEGVGTRPLALALFTAALYKAIGASPALAAAWKAEGRIHTTAVFLHRAASGPRGEEALAALRAQPELREAAELRRAALGDHPGMSDWVLGRIAGDSALEQAAARAFTRPELELELKIEARLRPGQAREQAEHALFLSKGGPPR